MYSLQRIKCAQYSGLRYSTSIPVYTKLCILRLGNDAHCSTIFLKKSAMWYLHICKDLLIAKTFTMIRSKCVSPPDKKCGLFFCACISTLHFIGLSVCSRQALQIVGLFACNAQNWSYAANIKKAVCWKLL